jgi:hypothetical protein
LNKINGGIAYDLKSQNKRDKNYQTSSQMIIRCSSTTSANAERPVSKRKELNESQRQKRYGN